MGRLDPCFTGKSIWFLRPMCLDLRESRQAVDTAESWPLLAPDPALLAAAAGDGGGISFGTITSDCTSLGSIGHGGSITYSQECWSKDIDVAARSILSRLPRVDSESDAADSSTDHNISWGGVESERLIEDAVGRSSSVEM